MDVSWFVLGNVGHIPWDKRKSEKSGNFVLDLNFNNKAKSFYQ